VRERGGESEGRRPSDEDEMNERQDAFMKNFAGAAKG